MCCAIPLSNMPSRKHCGLLCHCNRRTGSPAPIEGAGIGYDLARTFLERDKYPRCLLPTRGVGVTLQSKNGFACSRATNRVYPSRRPISSNRRLTSQRFRGCPTAEDLLTTQCSAFEAGYNARPMKNRIALAAGAQATSGQTALVAGECLHSCYCSALPMRCRTGRA